MRQAELYLLTFSSGRQYIGQTCSGVARRYSQHRRDAERGSKKVMHRAWRKYGAPRLDVLVRSSQEYVVEIEPKAIAVYRSRFPHGYNMADGGEIAPTKAAIVASKISATKKGKRPSDATLTAAWAANRGKKWTDEQKQKLTASRFGRAISEETRRKISEAQKGKPRPVDGIVKMAAALRGKKQSKETIEKRKLSRANHRNPPSSYVKMWQTRRTKAAEAGES